MDGLMERVRIYSRQTHPLATAPGATDMRKVSTLTGKNLPRLAVAKRGWPETITTGCGCIFCDIGLAPDTSKDGKPAHSAERGSVRIVCTKSEKPAWGLSVNAVHDFTRVCDQTGLSEKLRK